MNKQNFIKLIKSQLDWNKKISELENILQSELYMSDIYTHTVYLFEYIIKNTFTKETEDFIYEYIYDIQGQNLEYLWDKVKKHIKNGNS